MMSSSDKTLARLARERRNRPKLLANEDKEFDDLLKTAEEARRKAQKELSSREYSRERGQPSRQRGLYTNYRGRSNYYGQRYQGQSSQGRRYDQKPRRRAYSPEPKDERKRSRE